MITCVSSRLCQRLLWDRAGPGGQVLAVEAGGVVWVNCYVPPHANPQAVINGIADDLAIDSTRRWMAIGDWNELPRLLRPPAWTTQVGVRDQGGDWLPTRYDAQRCIDHGFAYGVDVARTAFDHHKLSDHKIFGMDVRDPGGGLATEHRFEPTQSLGRPPGVPQDTWVEVSGHVMLIA